MLFHIPGPMWAVYGVALLIFLIALAFVLLFGSSRPHN